MTFEEANTILSNELGLLYDVSERGLARTYFLERVCWQPARNTRIARVAYSPAGQVVSIRLCVSSDNNNSVFVRTPMEEGELRAAVIVEIEEWRRSHQPSAPVGIRT